MTTHKHSSMGFYRERKLSWRNGHFFYYFDGPIYLSSVSLSGLLLFSLYLQLTLVTLYIRIKRFSEQSVVFWSIIQKQ